MAYSIFRQMKLKRAAVFGMQAEHERTPDDHYKRGKDFDNSNIDWSRTHQNWHLAFVNGSWKRLQEPNKNWNKSITEMIKEHGCKEIMRGKNASTVLLDNLFTASPEFFENADIETIKKYFFDCLNWYVKEFCQGDASRIISCEVHFDEKTPHMHLCSVPLFESEKGFTLSAKALSGQFGRNTYHVMQDRFYEAVGRPRAFERGEVVDIHDPVANAQKKHHTLCREYQIFQQDQKLQEQEKQLQGNEKKIQLVQEYNDFMNGNDEFFNDFAEFRTKKQASQAIEEQMRSGETVPLADLWEQTR